MAKKTKHTDIYKYSGRKSMDGKPLKENEVLVPFWIQEGSHFQEGGIIDENCTVYHIAGCLFRICFIPVNADRYEEYMGYFWSEINEYLKRIRIGRCILSHTANGEPVCCPKNRRCTGCPDRGKLPRHNPSDGVLHAFSFNLLMDSSHYEPEGPGQLTPEEIICLLETPSVDEYFEIIASRLEKDNPRYAQIIRLCRQRIPAEEIFRLTGLKASRGYQEIRNAYNACCDLLDLGCYKKKKKKKKK